MLRLASYNVHKCSGLTGPHAPERNLAVIRALKPDIIALQEVDFRLGNRPQALPRDMIEDQTGLWPALLNGTGEQSLGWHGQTLLMRREFAEIASIRRLPLPGLEPRGALALILPEMTVIAVHLGLTRTSRRAQLSRIVAQAARLPGQNIAIMGDFNEWRDDRGLEPLADFESVVPGPSYPALLPRLRLDRIMLSGQLRMLRNGVFDNEDAREASDHLPIWADVELLK